MMPETTRLTKPEGTDQWMRVIEGTEIGTIIPAVDFADAIGYARTTISNIIGENKALFEGSTVFKALPTSGGVQQFLCLNSTACERVLLLMKPAKNRKELCEKVEAFRERAFTALAEKKEVAPVPALIPAVNTIEAEIQRARMLARESGRDERAFLAVAYRKCGVKEYIEALNETGGYVHGEPGWYNPSELVAMCPHDPQLTAERLNWYLHNNPKNPGQGPYQFRDENRVWRLTALGWQYGREYIFHGRGGHQEPRIEWREEILYVSGLKRRENTEPARLPAASAEG